MKVFRSLLGSAVAAALLTASTACFAFGDWADAQVTNDLAVVRPLPANMQVQAQNPPGIQWPRHKSKPAQYMLELTGPDGVKNIPVSRLWYLPAKKLTPGTYSWRVRPGNTTDWTALRTFVITSASADFEIPDDETLRSRTQSRSRPRSLQIGFQTYKNWSAPQLAERKPAFDAMVNDVAWRIPGMTDVSDSEWVVYPAAENSAAKAAQLVKIGQRISGAARQLESAALLYRLTGEVKYLNEALRRGDALAALSVSGPTAYIYTDAPSRQIALALIKGIDQLYNEIGTGDAGRRARWLASVNVRTQQMYQDVAGADGRLDMYPFDSHGGSNLGYLTVIAALSVGLIPEADAWFTYSFRAYAHQIYIWSSPEGGFANGTAYGTYTAVISTQLWQTLKLTTGVDLFTKPWSAGFLNFLMQFLPPGTKNNVFGDEHELVPNMGAVKGFAARFATPQAAWYYKSLAGSEEPSNLLQAPYPMPASTVTPVAPANAAVFPSIGWAAMHSNITDTARTSVFFKSSPFGAYNHSHGDQNSVVLFSGGVPLLIEAGYEDYYGSPMAANWYRQTKAHNAVTYDGGIGQLITGNVENLGRPSKITAFSTTSSVDFVEGDAIQSYGTALSTARRQVWYLRNSNAVVVRDILAAPVARSFEWNFHAPVSITNPQTGEYQITNGARSVCVRSIGPTPATFKKWAGTAPLAGTFEDHAAFVLPAATAAEFLVLLDVGCKRPAVQLSTTATGRTLKVGSDTIAIGK